MFSISSPGLKEDDAHVSSTSVSTCSSTGKDWGVGTIEQDNAYLILCHIISLCTCTITRTDLSCAHNLTEETTSPLWKQILQGITESILEQNDENIYDLYKKIGSIGKKKNSTPSTLRNTLTFIFSRILSTPVYFVATFG